MFIDDIVPPICYYCATSIREGLLCKECNSQLSYIHPIAAHSKRDGRFLCLWDYQGLPAFLIKKWKFNQDIVARDIILSCVDSYLTEFREEFSDIDFVGFIPMHPLKERFVRWWNPAAVIANYISNKLNIPLVDALSVRLFKPELHKIRDRDLRLKKIRNSFRIREGALERLLSVSKEIRFLLVDDIVTTEATFKEASYTLVKAVKNLVIKGFVLCG